MFNDYNFRSQKQSIDLNLIYSQTQWVKHAAQMTYKFSTSPICSNNKALSIKMTLGTYTFLMTSHLSQCHHSTIKSKLLSIAWNLTSLKSVFMKGVFRQRQEELTHWELCMKVSGKTWHRTGREECTFRMGRIMKDFSIMECQMDKVGW